MSIASTSSHFERYRTNPDNTISTREKIDDEQKSYYNELERELRKNTQFKTEAKKIGLDAQNINYEIKRNSNNQIGICLLRHPKDAGIWFQANSELTEILKKFCEEPAAPIEPTPEPPTFKPSTPEPPILEPSIPIPLPTKRKISALSNPIALRDISGASATRHLSEIHPPHVPQSEAIAVKEISSSRLAARASSDRNAIANAFPLDAYYFPQHELQAGAPVDDQEPRQYPFDVHLRHVVPNQREAQPLSAAEIRNMRSRASRISMLAHPHIGRSRMFSTYFAKK